MHFKWGKTLFGMLVSKGPEREVYFKGKQSLSGPAWEASAIIPKVSTKIKCILMGKTHSSGSYLARALREKYLLKESNLFQGPWDELIKKGIWKFSQSLSVFSVSYCA